MLFKVSRKKPRITEAIGVREVNGINLQDYIHFHNLMIEMIDFSSNVRITIRCLEGKHQGIEA